MKHSSRYTGKWAGIGLFALLLCGLSCAGPAKDGTEDVGAGGSGTGTGGNGGAGGGPDGTPKPPFEPFTAQSTVRKVKNLLTGLPATDEEVHVAITTGAAGIRKLVTDWMKQPEFKDRMLLFFRNSFQQAGFDPLNDFQFQLLQNGGFDFTSAPGDDAYARLIQNLEDSFALTAWQLASEGLPFTEALTTRRFMMTTALKSLYSQIEMPNDARATTKLTWKVDMSGAPIPIEDTLNPASPNYMVFSDEPPITPGRTPRVPSCVGTAGMINPFTTYALLFSRLLGETPRYNVRDATTMMNVVQCYEHASKPYFNTQDLTDWQWVTIRPLNAGEARIVPYDLPALRKASELALALPRVGFYTTPAFLAIWNTNDSNQHRVTANQTLLVALGESFSSDSSIIPLSTTGLDAKHSVTSGECYGCHKSLDPIRQFWATQFDYNDRNDFPARGGGNIAPNPRPTTIGGALAFRNVNAQGADMFALGPLLAQVAEPDALSRFALTFTQKLCFFANSSACSEDDPEFRRVARWFQDHNFDFLGLVQELFSSPLVTAASPTATFQQNGVTISIARRDQLCGALSNRLGKPDLCGLYVPLPTAAQAATGKIASSLPADAFSRGSETPITATDATLFYRSASEMLCENIALQAVDAANGESPFKSANLAAALDDLARLVMGYPASDPHHAQAKQILQSHYNAVLAVKGNSATTALRSTFALACESPTALAIGL